MLEYKVRVIMDFLDSTAGFGTREDLARFSIPPLMPNLAVDLKKSRITYQLILEAYIYYSSVYLC